MSSNKGTHREYSLNLPSRQDQIERVEELTDRVSKEMNFSEAERDKIAIAVTEAVNNAILHGNKLDPAKNVFIHISSNERSVTFSIRDQGSGFDPDSLPDPLDPQNLLKESGRGIFILKSLMDEVTFDFSDSGTEIVMVKYRNETDEQTSEQDD